MTVSVVMVFTACGPGWCGGSNNEKQNQHAMRYMTKKDITEEEALTVKYRKFDADGNHLYDSLSHEQMQAILKMIYAGKLQIIEPED